MIAVPVLVLAMGRIALERSRLARLHKTPVPIGAAMNLYGIAPADAEAAGLEGEIQDAICRCMACTCAEQCREWPATCQRKGFEAACPNAPLFRHTRAYKGI